MKTIIKELDCFNSEFLNTIYEPEKILFFDIEAPGLSPSSSELYLIGMIYIKDGKYQLRQLFSENMGDEKKILKEFFEFSACFSVFFTFNGDTFDFRYLEKCASQYQTFFPLKDVKSIDLYKVVRKLRDIFSLNSCKQKCVEEFLGINREDKYGGGELIEVYNEYRKTGDALLFNLLTLHNEDDLKGLTLIIPVLYYSHALSVILSGELKPLYETQNGYLTVSYEFFYTFPKVQKIYLNPEAPDSGFFLFSGNKISLHVKLFEGELKFFYPNIKDYYYLPEEDMAIHSKLAILVNKDRRMKADKTNCYTRMSGTFLPCFPKVKNTKLYTFRKDYNSMEIFNRFEDSEEFIFNYISELINAYFKINIL